MEYNFDFNEIYKETNSEENTSDEFVDYNLYINKHEKVDCFVLTVKDNYDDREKYKLYPVKKINLNSRIEQLNKMFKKSNIKIINNTNEKID